MDENAWLDEDVSSRGYVGSAPVPMIAGAVVRPSPRLTREQHSRSYSAGARERGSLRARLGDTGSGRAERGDATRGERKNTGRPANPAISRQRASCGAKRHRVKFLPLNQESGIVPKFDRNLREARFVWRLARSQPPCARLGRGTLLDARGAFATLGGQPAACLPLGDAERYPSRVRPFVAFGALVLSLATTSCAPSAPPRWAEGGAQLLILPAHWERPGEDSVEIQPNGKVLEGGHLRFVSRPSGPRVTDDDYETARGTVLRMGASSVLNDTALGYVGLNNASLRPVSQASWLSLQPDGRVLFFEPGGDRTTGGAWRGCDGPARRTCTLVTQIFAMKHYRAQPATGVTFGVGVGVGPTSVATLATVLCRSAQFYAMTQALHTGGQLPRTNLYVGCTLRG